MSDNRNDASFLYLKSLQEAIEGNLDDAQNSLEKALEIEPDNVMFQLLLANILKSKGSIAPACQLLLNITQKYPDSAAAFNNLGTIYFAQNKFSQAISAYEKALNIQPDYLDVYYNLGLVFNKSKRYKEAENAFSALIAMAHQHMAARFQLACLLMQQFKYQEASEHFLEIEKNQPFHFETLTNLATCYLRLRNLSEAKTKYLQALDLIANDTQVLFNLGIISAKQGRTKEAIEFYLRVLKEDSNFFSAHNNLGIAYLALKNKDAALLHFRAALHLQPNNAALKHTVNLITRTGDLSFSPPEYVRALFDSYADHYDQHLSHELNYAIPQVMYTTIQEIRGKNHQQWDILDLGCGTGLCGEYFKSLANSLIGVDISAKMLEVAAQKNIYTALHESDILSFLTQYVEKVDLILAGDVLVYFGNLEVIFSQVKRALKKHGFFIFNTEISDDDNFVMTASGRFGHSKKYLESVANAQGFKIVVLKKINLRMQEEVPVEGHVCVVQLYPLHFKMRILTPILRRTLNVFQSKNLTIQ